MTDRQLDADPGPFNAACASHSNRFLRKRIGRFLWHNFPCRLLSRGFVHYVRGLCYPKRFIILDLVQTTPFHRPPNLCQDHFPGNPPNGRSQNASLPRRHTASLGVGRPGSKKLAGLGGSLEPITEGIVVTTLEPAFLALAFARFYQVLQAPRALLGRSATFGAPVVSLHTQLILALT